ncbi:MAG: sulfatase [Planctomycetes bacterium]|nr:sulfatase [Planctomycetota bacterium]
MSILGRLVLTEFFILCVSAVAPAQEQDRGLPVRNVVVLLADDWRHDVLGCAGHPVIRTPHLDRLAREGTRFTRHAVTTSICGVSRACLFTGQWMSRHGCRGFDAFATPWEQTYPGLLRASGRFTGHVGKWHNGAFPPERFDFARSYGGRYWFPGRDKTREHVTWRNERDALAFLRERPQEQPFALTLAFFAPHAEDGHPEQYLAQPASDALYADAEIPAPPTATEEHLRRLPPFLQDERNEGRVRFRWRFDTEEKRLAMMRRYFRLITEVDAACGAVLAELERQGLFEETLVLFTTDNGYFHGEHGLADKWYPYEESLRVPLIVRDPRLAAERRGRTNDALTLNVDLAPTILAALGVAAPPTMQGRDLAPLYLAPEPPPWRTEFFYEHPAITSEQRIPSSEALVTRTRKFIRWPAYDVEELFDLERDPREERNLAADPAHAAELTALRSRLITLRSAAR